MELWWDTIRMAKIEKMRMPNVGEDMGPLKLSRTASENIKWNNCFWKTGSFLKSQIYLYFMTAISLLRIYLRKMKI